VNIKELLKLGAKVKAYDPEAMDNVREIMGNDIKLCEDEYAALEDADALLIMTEWPVFRTPEFEKLSSSLKNKVIFDGRNLYDPKEIEQLGFEYFSIGRKK